MRARKGALWKRGQSQRELNSLVLLYVFRLRFTDEEMRAVSEQH